MEGPERHIAEVLLWLFHSLWLCYAIFGEFVLYIGGKLVSQPDLIIIYIACHPQKWSSDISGLLQMQHTPAFSLESLDFLFFREYSITGKTILDAMRYGIEVTAHRIVCIESVNLCGPRSNVDLTQYMWSTFEYYCANYAVIVLPTRASDSKIAYLRHYRAEIGGEASRLCGQCVCITKNPRAYYDFGCKKLRNCTCAVCCKQPHSLKTAASEIVYGLCNKPKFRFHNITTFKPFEIPEIPEDGLSNILFSLP